MTYLSVREVVQRLRASRTTVYTLVADGHLAVHRVGRGRGTIRISSVDLHAFLQRTRSVPAVAAGFRHVRLS